MRDHSGYGVFYHHNRTMRPEARPIHSQASAAEDSQPCGSSHRLIKLNESRVHATAQYVRSSIRLGGTVDVAVAI